MGHNLEWSFGRQLTKFDTTSYTYDEEGIRTSKTVDGITTIYYLDETNIIEQITGNTVIRFYYDSNDEIIGFTYNEADYFYVKNAMSDIIGIADDSGNLVVSYAYDAWGKVLSVIGSNIELGNLNPYRYRSYYYDTETEFYYLQSRYYDPEICRFINSDDVKFIGFAGTVGSYNAFAYCENNPIHFSDPFGCAISYKVLQGVLGGILGGITQYISDLINVRLFYEEWSKATKYVSAVVKGAWDAVTNSGFFKKLLVAIGSNIIGQIINKIRYKVDFSCQKIFKTVIDFTFNYVVGEILNIKAPIP